MERELAQGMILSAGYFGTRGNHLTREAEENPFEPALGHRYNPNLASPLLAELTDGQSFYNSFQVSVSKRYAHNLFWQASYTLAHSVDDASVDFSVESVNDPPTISEHFRSQGKPRPVRLSTFGTISWRMSFTICLDADVSWVAGRSRLLPAFTAAFHLPRCSTSTMPICNRWLIPERPDLVGNPYAGVCPNGARVGTPSCWFNPSAFAVPPAGQFGNAGRNILRGPAFAQFDASLHKDFAIEGRRKITVGVEAYNLFNHPNFGVPSNTQSPLTLGGNGDAVFKDAAGNFADNAGQILTTAGTGRQIQLAARFTF